MMTKLVIANWKMNGSLEQIRSLLSELAGLASSQQDADSNVVVCPPSCYLSFTLGRLAEIGWKMGAQDCSEHTSGAFTGETAASMLADIGCRYVLVGHSERRQHHHETNAVIHQKMFQVFQAGLQPVLCIGETLEERENGRTLEVITTQLQESMSDGCLTHPFVIAYEPVWAIGTGRVAELKDIQEVHVHIQQFLKHKDSSLSHVPILYGGSVNSGNAEEILDLDEVNGVLVGGASLKAKDFAHIITCANK